MTSDEQLFAAIAFDCGHEQGHAEGIEHERKAIVDWLRKSGYNQIAYCIEKEAHRE
jgi:hypothetical protein